MRARCTWLAGSVRERETRSRSANSCSVNSNSITRRAAAITTSPCSANHRSSIWESPRLNGIPPIGADSRNRWSRARQVQQNQARRDGHVEAVPERGDGNGAASRDPVRQVPHHASSRGGARQGAQGGIRPRRRQGPALHQGPEVHAAVASRESLSGRQALARTAAGRQQAPQHRLRPEGVLRPTVDLPARELGPPFLRQLAREPEMATSQTLRALCRNDRSALGRNRRLLQTREQSLTRFRRGPQQQDPSVSATRIRPERRGISPPKSPLLHAPAHLNPPKSPTRFPEDPLFV